MYYILVDDSSTDGGSHSPQYTHLYCITLDAICEIAVNLTLYVLIRKYFTLICYFGGVHKCLIPNRHLRRMADFNSLRANFSVEDEGARDLSEQEFVDLNRVEAEKLIANVKNVKVKSGLQKIYDQAHSHGKTIIICSSFIVFTLFVVFSCLLSSCILAC
jgi:hypothetical protein